jgi:DNA polymerase-4
MRKLFLYFPNLSVAIARRGASELVDRPLILVAGEGDSALVAGASAEAAMMGVSPGMSARAARVRCPAAAVIADNAAACLDALDEAASILRLRATPNVAVVSREHIVVDLAGLEARFADEAIAADRLASLVRQSTGSEVRAAVADSFGAARHAARGARRCAQVLPATGAAEDTPFVPHDSSRSLTGSRTLPAGADARAARADLVRLLSRLFALVDGREESARRIRVVFERAGTAPHALRLDAPAPFHSAADAVQLLSGRTTDDSFAGVCALTVALEKLGPSVRVQPRPAAPARTAPVVAAPVRPVQQRLLRAG